MTKKDKHNDSNRGKKLKLGKKGKKEGGSYDGDPIDVGDSEDYASMGKKGRRRRNLSVGTI